MSADPAVIHAGALAKFCAGAWRGVLVLGPSGAGKSDLALRALAAGWRLVADDYSLVWASGGRLWARAPERICDRIEARGLGIVGETCRALAPIGLAVAAETGEIERMPEPETMTFAGVETPLLRLNLLQASALAKLDRALMPRGL
ncbi:MAG TPA: aldolase [Caulobacteraceae bacterium]|nr:aldolase [Caulobacteraceae bacterium]